MAIIDTLLAPVITLIETTIQTCGPFGVSILMAIESCNIPLPSEAILPFAGFMVQQGHFNIHEIAFAAAFGCLLGSIPSYYLGYFGGRPFIEKYGKWFLISKKDLEMADKWEKKYGNLSFFICRMLPIVRTFISLPAGILKADIKQFSLFTFLGSLIWSYPLVYVGMKLGEHTEGIKHFLHKFDLIIAIAIVVLFVWYVKTHIKNLKES